jgi:hypothetical protein
VGLADFEEEEATFLEAPLALDLAAIYSEFTGEKRGPCA